MQISSLDVEILPRGLMNFALFDDVITSLFIFMAMGMMVVVIMFVFVLMAMVVVVMIVAVAMAMAVVMIVTVRVTVPMAMSRALLATDMHMASFARVQNLDLNAVKDA